MKLKKLSMRLWKQDALRKLSWIIKHLSPQHKILDLGSGSCFLSSLLMDKGFEVTPVDVQNLSSITTISPLIYDGRNLPFKEKAYDVVLLLTVLHHVKDFRATIREARRVSNKIIIIEDIYYNTFQKYLIYFFDSLVNFEFLNHPHNNLNDLEWKALFHGENLVLEDAQYHPITFFCTQATYCLTVK
ncbi:class I SAM-dependent methyltransferase [Reichenbachiella sp.]|uniref:class I SAM-dependent methyltransferase n=1 Tax=Reichenbachiella sp. TaxID=2184521 RepID=UPI003298EABF